MPSSPGSSLLTFWLGLLDIHHQSDGLTRYQTLPLEYARNVLGIKTLTRDQCRILNSLTVPPYRTLVKAGHEVGKTLTAAIAVSWWFDTHVPSIALTTAPKYSQVKDVLWKEVRRIRGRAGLGGFPGPKVPRLEAGPDHFAVGMTANSAEAFQGHHGPAVLVVFDEAVGVSAEFWEAAHTMAHSFLAIYNPTDTTSQAYQEENQTERPYTVLEMSQLSHPNVEAHLAGRPLPVPQAVKPWDMETNLKAWSTPIPADQARKTDVEWPPGCGKWYRPGPLAEARVLGRWPSQGTYGVWSDADWQAAEDMDSLEPPRGVLPRIGLDVAVFGDDRTAFHVRVGNVSLAHESYGGRDTDHTIGRAVQLADQWAAWATERTDPHAAPVARSDIRFCVDSGGVGADLHVRMRAAGLTAIPVNAGTPASDPASYPNKRSELWFSAAERARAGKLKLARLDAETRRRLKQQAMAPRWRIDAQGRRVVEDKAATKASLGRSPDDMDALNLAYYEHPEFMAPAVIGKQRRESRFFRHAATD